jgi:hypothetical protein
LLMISPSGASLNKTSSTTCHREVEFDSHANGWEASANAGLPSGDF